MSLLQSTGARAYPWYHDIVPFLGGLADPLMGITSAAARFFRSFPLPPTADTPKRRKRGVTFVLGGIEGPSQHSRDMGLGLLRGGYRGAVSIFPWNRCVPVIGVFRNLMSHAHHEQQSDVLVELIRQHRSAYQSPVNFIAQSGGCFVAVRTLEKLDAADGVAQAILLAPSISPDYDIRPAAQRCSGGLYSVGGRGDYFFLGLGTMLLGTSDRVHTPSAGLVGWHHRHEKFHEVRWHPSWTRHGYVGNHITTSSRRFIAEVIAPIFRKP
ncbi:MAG: hypothetical protein HBSAPP02_14260 [Phycisphaerae bacterium]|nr:MAG: hypothetical protein HRU71_07665 [Planctomycetia bacterium]RIK71278.1 MAG: hypothetical protein DCC66_01445 [Planctomycetota bacterium]GJQ26394.1 MAG: hypothetical protein HBSAPP02_14260 [Phycisphaerae bacterium]